MDLRHLRYFVAVAELLNFTKAAAQLRVAQPALSRQIRDLEDHLGVPLLERTPRFVRLTDAGAAFLLEARAVLARAEQAAFSMRAFATGERGELHLGYAPSPTVELLPQALQAFQKQCPGVRVTLHDFSVKETLAGLRAGTLDAALTVASSARDLRGLVFEPLRTYALCLAAPRTHPLARRPRVSLAQIKGEKLVIYDRSEYPEYLEWLTRLFGTLGGVPPIAEEHDSANSLITAVESGHGLALVPSVLACLAGPRLVLKPIHPSPEPVVVGLAYPRRHCSAAARRFAATVKTKCADPAVAPK
jgi:DNA-binding transcriptional LysR family regulator